jgi:hypothetical protein
MRLNQRARKIMQSLLREAATQSFKKKYSLVRFLLEGGAGGHMQHPYENQDFTIGDIKEIVKKASKGVKMPEKFDGSVNLHFSVIPTGQPVKMEDIIIIRKADADNVGNIQNTLNWMRQKFAASPGFESMYIGAKAIALGCMQLSPALISEVFDSPDPNLMQQGKDFKGTYVNCDILWPKKTIQINYGQFKIAMHELKDYYGQLNAKNKMEIDFTDSSEVGLVNQNEDEVYAFDTYNDPRFMKFSNALKQALIKVSNEELIAGLNPEFFQPEEFSFSYGGKELITLNTLTEEEQNMILKDLLELQAKHNFTDDMTLGDIKGYFLYQLVPGEVARIRVKLESMTDFPTVVNNPAALDYMANYLVYNVLLKDDVKVPESAAPYAVGAVKGKNALEALGVSKDVTKAMAGDEKKYFTADPKLNKYYREVVKSLKPEISEQLNIFKELFYNLGVELMSGVRSSIMSPEYAEKESTRITNELVAALEDFYQIPYFDEVNYTNSYGRQVQYMDYEQFMEDNPDSPIEEKAFKQMASHNTKYVDKMKYNVYKIELLIQSANRKLGIPVDLNNKQDIIEKAKNLKVDALEGTVFSFKGNKFKFTGAYAPINQFIGFSYVKALPQFFPRYFANKFNFEQGPDVDTICIIPGSFKPPHMGHRKMIEYYIGLGCQQIVVMVSDPSKEESVRTIGENKSLTAADAIILWQKLCADLMQRAKIDFITCPANPLESAASLILKGSKIRDNTTVYFGGSQKIVSDTAPEDGATDADRMSPMIYNRVARMMTNPTLNIKNPGEFGAPAAVINPRYIDTCQKLGIYESLPSVMSGKDPTQFHASDLRYLLNEVLVNPGIKQALVYYLKDLSVVNFYINYIWGQEAMNKSNIVNDQITIEESLLRKYLKMLIN